MNTGSLLGGMSGSDALDGSSVSYLTLMGVPGELRPEAFLPTTLPWDPPRTMRGR
jgi:hypothetical protein